MEIVLSDDSKYQEPLETRLLKFATTLIGAEIDFVIKSVDEAIKKRDFSRQNQNILCNS
jgi:hypothetical protein